MPGQKTYPVQVMIVTDHIWKNYLARLSQFICTTKCEKYFCHILYQIANQENNDYFDDTDGQWYMHQSKSILENTTQNALGFWDKKRSSNPSQKSHFS